jgi:hypothetical protein
VSAPRVIAAFPGTGKTFAAGRDHRLLDSDSSRFSWGTPGVVFVEHPAGQHPKPQLYYAVGCTAAALYRSLRRRTGFVPRIEFTTSGHWKLVATGSGKQPKPRWGKHGGGKTWEQVRETYGVLSWARVNGYTGEERDCWDDADALAMAECARRDVAIRMAG